MVSDRRCQPIIARTTVDIIVNCSAPMDGKISTQDRLVNKMPIVAILALAAVAFAMVYIF